MCIDVRAGQAVVTRAGERVRYTTPEPDGAEYVAVCLPAFSPDDGSPRPGLTGRTFGWPSTEFAGRLEFDRP